VTRTYRRAGLIANIVLSLAALGVSLALAELGFQLFARLVIFPGWDRDMARPNFFLIRSEDPVLAYELAPSYEIETDGKRLHINRWGVRADSDDQYVGRRKIAILGDSVTMGAGHSQERTIDRLLEQRLREDGRDTVVLNFGVPGYATRELAEFLRQENAIYRVDQVLYLLNPNDFARRDSVYEGADNGLYRMFVRPTWQTPWFLRKAVYRLVKDAPASVRWYSWLFAANEARARMDIQHMAAHCAERGAAFSVVLMPSGAAYGREGYALAEMYGRLVSFLRSEGIPVIAPIEEFAADPGRYFDETDHLHDIGNERMAEIMANFLAGL
jgi:lysophospholipase L1-like esterase